jgi:uncharacterized damage-inducible protein DinB
MADSEYDIRKELLETLEYQRASARAIVDGLSEDLWHQPVVASGWTVAGLVEHLCSVERHWFQGVIAGADIELPWDEGRPPYHPEMSFTCDRPSADILAFYQAMSDRSDEILAGVRLPDASLGKHDDEAESLTVSAVILHVIEEIAAHTGHLEIARELLDGKTNLGLR